MSPCADWPSWSWWSRSTPAPAAQSAQDAAAAGRRHRPAAGRSRNRADVGPARRVPRVDCGAATARGRRRRYLTRAAASAAGASAIVRERARRPTASGFEVLADVLVSRGREGRIATWQLARPAASRQRRSLRARRPVRSSPRSDGLLRLELDPTRQFAVHNLTISGAGFHAARWRRDRRSSPSRTPASRRSCCAAAATSTSRRPIAAEQGQLRLFTGGPSFVLDDRRGLRPA